MKTIQKLIKIFFGIFLFVILWSFLTILNYEFFDNMDKISIIRKLFGIISRKGDTWITFALSGGFTGVSLFLIFNYRKLAVKLLFIAVEMYLIHICFRFKQSDWLAFSPYVYPVYIGLLSFFGVKFLFGNLETQTESAAFKFNFNFSSFWKSLKFPTLKKETQRNILEIPETDMQGEEILHYIEKGFLQKEISQRIGISKGEVSKRIKEYKEVSKNKEIENKSLKVA